MKEFRWSEAGETHPQYQQMIGAVRMCRDGRWGVVSLGEALAAAIVLERQDVLDRLGYTLEEAWDRIGPLWATFIQPAREELREE